MFFSGMITKVNLGNLDDKEYILIPDAQRLDAITLFSPNTHEIIGNFYTVLAEYSRNNR